MPETTVIVTMPETTLIVDIDQQHLPDLQAFVTKRGGKYRTWDLVLGQYGQQYISLENPELLEQFRSDLVNHIPDQECPSWNQLPENARRDILQIAANSYSWMHEGYFEEEDFPDLLVATRDYLVPRTNQIPPKADQMMDYLSEHNVHLGPWDQVSTNLQLLVTDVAVNSREWQEETRLTDSQVSIVRYRQNSKS